MLAVAKLEGRRDIIWFQKLKAIGLLIQTLRVLFS